MTEAWREFSDWSAGPGGKLSQMPPEGVFVSESGKLVAGCCIYPSPGMMVVGHILTHPALGEQSEARVLRFLLRVLDGHKTITNRFMLVDMVWAVDDGGLLKYRMEAPSGMHGVPDTEIPETKELEDHSETGTAGEAAKNSLEARPPTTNDEPPKEKPAPKARAKARPKAGARKRKAKSDE